LRKNSYLLLIILLIILILSSCSRTKPLMQHHERSKSMVELNYLGKNKESYIRFNSGKIVHATTIEVTEDSLKYKPINSDDIKKISLKEIKSIHFKDHYVSIFDGSLFGFIGGLISGFLYVDRDSDMSGLAIAGISAGGTIIGAIIGGLIGSKIEYKINSNKKYIRKK